MDVKGILSVFPYPYNMEVFIIKLKNHEEKLEREREKLDLLIDEVMSAPIAKNKALIKQSRKVDALIVKVQKEMEKSNKSKGEHDEFCFRYNHRKDDMFGMVLGQAEK